SSAQMSGRRVGFCQSDKRWRQVSLVAFAELCISVSHWSQGPFEDIVHKLSDVIVEAEYDSQSQQLLDNFQGYVSGHPHTVLLDPLPAMSQLLDRFASKQIMNWQISSPPYLEISTSDLSVIQEDVESKGLSFPLICKTRVAHGSRSHEVRDCLMDGLSDGHPPCVLQSIVNPGAVLHKVFVLGEYHFTVERPSLKNFPPGPQCTKTIFFNSHEVSKPESSPTSLQLKVPRLPPPSGEAMLAPVRDLRAKLGMAMFGVDVIVSINTHTLTIINISIFPGYEGVPQFFSSLLSHIESVLDPRELEVPQAICPLAPSVPQAEL
uniref:Inositol-tetrakisphosphate 1-kinase n=1 Tax=Hucho hucho TaxID=62062 RepID=A0A4W5NCQ4_9TELE